LLCAAKVTIRNLRFQGVDSTDAGALAVDMVRPPLLLCPLCCAAGRRLGAPAGGGQPVACLPVLAAPAGCIWCCSTCFAALVERLPVSDDLPCLRCVHCLPELPQGATVQVWYSDFSKNHAFAGAGATVRDPDTSAEFQFCTFWENKVDGEWAVQYCRGTAMRGVLRGWAVRCPVLHLLGEQRGWWVL
jgi:hypothetical protein